MILRTLVLFVTACCGSLCFARTNPYLAGSNEAALWDAIEANCWVLKGPPAQLQWLDSTQMHNALRGIEAAMSAGAGATQIDNYPSDDAAPAYLKIRWSRSTISSSSVDIVICTTANSSAATPAQAQSDIRRGESSAYADGGNYTGSGNFDGGDAVAEASAPMCLAVAIGGKANGAAGHPNSCSEGGDATATTSNSDSSAIAQGGDESTKGGSGSATSTGSSSSATAFGGNSTKRYLVPSLTPYFVGHKGGTAVAQSTGNSIAHGGNGANSSGRGNISGDGGDATINGAASSSSEICTGGDPGDAVNGSTAGSAGNPVINQ